MTPGAPAVTESGVAISLGSSELVVGSKTETCSAAGSGTVPAAGLAGLIMSGLGQVDGSSIVVSPSSATRSGSSVEVFLGAAVRQRDVPSLVLVSMLSWMVVMGC